MCIWSVFYRSCSAEYAPPLTDWFYVFPFRSGIFENNSPRCRNFVYLIPKIQSPKKLKEQEDKKDASSS